MTPIGFQSTEPPLVVLDTNVVLDWLLFCDPRCEALATMLVERRAICVATLEMRQELTSVLDRGTLNDWITDDCELWARWEQFARMVEPLSAPPLHRPRCTDPDDQKFIDLALQVGARALFSRDRAVLRCARPARALGLEIRRPEHWSY